MKSNITTEYQQYLLSDEWKQFRKKALKKARKREKKLAHLNGKKIKMRGSHKPHFNKQVKGNHALKLQHPVLDKIAELKRLREGRFKII